INLTLLPFYQHSLAVASVIILAYVLIFSLCMLGNMLVCFIVLKNRQMRTVTNIFILNLAISDLLVGILCLPITLVDNLITGKSYVHASPCCHLHEDSHSQSAEPLMSCDSSLYYKT
uniref:G-protein coupled receptors family 1 profile domain-containing protein n=1 Tax=Sinocyclocheilus grahami TaxID=75366 RepID=A0A672PKV0_SINGR